MFREVVYLDGKLRHLFLRALQTDVHGGRRARGERRSSRSGLHLLSFKSPKSFPHLSSLPLQPIYLPLQRRNLVDMPLVLVPQLSNPHLQVRVLASSGSRSLLSASGCLKSREGVDVVGEDMAMVVGTWPLGREAEGGCQVIIPGYLADCVHHDSDRQSLHLFYPSLNIRRQSSTARVYQG